MTASSSSSSGEAAEKEGVTIIYGADGFGEPLGKELLAHLQSRGIKVKDLGTGDRYYDVASEVGKRVAASGGKAKGLLLCGTGMGMAMVANKVPGIMAAVVENAEAAANSRSINNSNVLALGAMVTGAEAGKSIVDTWLSTPFKGPAPANQNACWSSDIEAFLDKSMGDIREIEKKTTTTAGSHDTEEGGAAVPCPICVLASEQPFEAVEGLKGCMWRQVRKDPTRAIVRFDKGGYEPAHHHTHGHDVIILSGHMQVENVTLGQRFELKTGDYLYTKGGQQHRVWYPEDTEFLISSDGIFDMFWDEPLPDEA